MAGEVEIRYKITKKGLGTSFWTLMGPLKSEILKVLKGRQARGLTRNRLNAMLELDDRHPHWNTRKAIVALRNLMREKRIERVVHERQENSGATPKVTARSPRLSGRSMPRITPKRPKLRR